MVTIEEINIDSLRKLKPYFFGLGFVKVKLTEKSKLHFYHPELDAFVENPHNHRYHFKSSVLRGTLVNDVWEEVDSQPESSRFRHMDVECCYTECVPEGEEPIEVPDTYIAKAVHLGQFRVDAVSEYYIAKDTFHSVWPDYTNGPCVTYVQRSDMYGKFAKYLKLEEEQCPYARKLSDDELWQIVEDCLK